MSDQTFFDTIKRSFTDVQTENGVNTTQFLEASESLVTLFDLLNSTAFAAVKADMNGNIKKTRDRQTAAPAKSETLQELVINEKAEKQKTATEGLMWLIRGLDFTSQALRNNLANSSEEVTTSFETAYGKTLKKHHNFVVKGMIAVALKACPYRKDFYAKLGSDQAKVHEHMEAWLKALEDIVKTMQAFYKEKVGEV